MDGVLDEDSDLTVERENSDDVGGGCSDSAGGFWDASLTAFTVTIPVRYA